MKRNRTILFRGLVECVQGKCRSKRSCLVSSVLVWIAVLSFSNVFVLQNMGKDPPAVLPVDAPTNQHHHPWDRRNQGASGILHNRRNETITSANNKIAPRFFLHVGPHKTATTSIQCALYQYREELKRNDSILFLGKVDEKFCSFPGKGKITQDHRIRKIDECAGDTDECWPKLTSEWEEHRRNGFDMVLSKEGISDLMSLKHSNTRERERFWQAMKQALVGWNVTVVLTYRRFFEWLPSAFNQHAFHMRLQARSKPYSHFPDEQPTTMEQMIEGVLRGSMSAPYPFVDTILKRKLPANWNYYVMNMHRTPDVVQAFVCDEVLETRHTCSNYQPVSQSRQSPADDLVYDYLNVQAFHWGWWIRQDRRGQRARSTRNFVQNVLNLSPLSFPQDCPSQSLLEKFLAYSIAMEDRILGSVDVAHHTDRFWKFSKHLCTVNATKVLLANSTTWKAFYAAL
jgi:hypothetical protein